MDHAVAPLDGGPHDTSLRSARSARSEALQHCAELLGRSWSSFDAARDGQPLVTEDVVALLSQRLPESGIGPIGVLDEVERILDQSLAQSRPRFFGYVGSSALEISVLAEVLAVAHDVNLASAAGAATMVEAETIRWVSEFIGFGDSTGSITSGGMVSNLTALAAARETALPGTRQDGNSTPCAVYASADGHSSVERAVELLGLGRRSLRAVDLDADRRMSVAALQEAIRRDRATGVTPLAVVATAGTTLTGAVDPLQAIADICAMEQVWMHVDGAYGLPAASTASAGALFRGLDRADSASLDAHKWLFVPKACSVLLVRDPNALELAFGHEAAYMVDQDRNPVDMTLEYSRPFRAMKLWAALRAHGAEAFREAIDANLQLAQLLATRVLAEPRLELLMQPQLSTVAFRARTARSGDELNKGAVATLQRDGHVFVTSAVVDGEIWIRPCFTNFRTAEADVHFLVDATLEALDRQEASLAEHSS